MCRFASFVIPHAISSALIHGVNWGIKVSRFYIELLHSIAKTNETGLVFNRFQDSTSFEVTCFILISRNASCG